MTGLEITKPDQLLADQETLMPDYGKFIAEPLARGFGHTLGNALRRVLLSSIQGAGIFAVTIDGASHEYSTIDGVQEDLVQVLLNLKKIQFRTNRDGTIVLHLNADGSCEITAADIKQSSGVEIANPDQHIVTLDQCDGLDMEILVRSGRGYATAGEGVDEPIPERFIPVDAKFSPVNRVNYKVEETRVGSITNFDRLILEVWTDGSVRPEIAVKQAAEILLDQFRIFEKFDETFTPPEKVIDEEKEKRKRSFQRPVAELDLTVRAANCIEAAGIQIVGQLVVKEEKELLEFRNFGRKSLEEIKKVLDEMDLYLSMKLDDDELLVIEASTFGGENYAS